MNVISKILKTAFKSASLASVLFVLGIYVAEGTPILVLEVIPAFFIVWVVTFIISIIAIPVTILPFYYLSNNALTIKFKKHFPIYSISFFIICLTATLLVDFIVGSLLFAITYITAMFAWIWFFKPEQI